MHDRDAGSVVDVSVTVHADIETTWDCLMTPSLWWPGTTIEPRLGGKLREEWTNGSGLAIVTTGIIDRLEAPDLVEMRWLDSDWPAGTETRVRIRLEATTPRRTAVHLRHRGWDRFGADAEDLRTAHRNGWSHHLRNLAARAGGPRGRTD